MLSIYCSTYYYLFLPYCSSLQFESEVVFFPCHMSITLTLTITFSCSVIHSDIEYITFRLVFIIVLDLVVTTFILCYLHIPSSEILKFLLHFPSILSFTETVFMKHTCTHGYTSIFSIPL